MHKLFNFELSLDELIENLRKGLIGMVNSDNFSNEDFNAAEEFIRFLYPIVHDGPMQVLKEMGGIMAGTSVSGELNNLNECWDECVNYWPAAETPVNYALTMMTLHSIVRRMEGAKRILSLGSGPGLYETFLAKKFPQTTITSVDVSKKMSEQHRKYVIAHASNQVVDCGTMVELPYDSGYFSIAICNNAIQWVAPHLVEKTVREIYRVTQKAGLTCLVLHPFAMTMLARMKQGQVRPVFKGLTGLEVLESCQRQGFKISNICVLAGNQTGQGGNHTMRFAAILAK
jgi:tRNA1(Val) A37 N6-methylase TrmN6